MKIMNMTGYVLFWYLQQAHPSPGTRVSKCNKGHQTPSFGISGGNSAGIFVSKMLPGIFVVKEK